jgi:nitroimidazol reductase NimA-like FMN-containing flavoprotein (pyridoxamine 5'-phosphate oxidase superfamily)
MQKDHTLDSRTQIRYAKRAVDNPEWIRQFLHKAPVGVLATTFGDQPFVNMNLFVYDEGNHCIYMHTAQTGRTQTNVESAAKVCFGVYEMGRLLPAAEALEFSVEYSGVVVFGRATLLTDDAQKTYALQKLLDKYFPHLEPGNHYRPITLDELKRTAVYRIDIEEWSGKRKSVAADFPGAFFYGNLPLPE